jgi:omega-6 fatty acid desaturase (delta-12 desaturase)
VGSARPSVVASAAATATIPVAEMTEQQRTEYANSLGYTRIGKELPDNVTLTDIIKTMPPEVSKACCY